MRKKIKSKKRNTILNSYNINNSVLLLSGKFKDNGFKVCADMLELILQDHDNAIIVSNIDYLIQKFLEKYPEQKANFNPEIKIFYKWCAVHNYPIEKITGFSFKRYISFFDIIIGALSPIMIIAGFFLLGEGFADILGTTYKGAAYVMFGIIGFLLCFASIKKIIRILRFKRWDLTQ